MVQRFIHQIENSTAHREPRQAIADAVMADRTLLPQLAGMALDVFNNNHFKACWSLELVLECDIKLLHPYLETFCNTLSSYAHHGAIRSVSKICLFIAQHDKSHPGFVTGKQTMQITEACLDWLIDSAGKVANKAYAMRVLYITGKDINWVYPELKRILQEDFTKHSAAYKSAAKEVLQKIEI